jgi:Protein of unknown function (DUF2799)
MLRSPPLSAAAFLACLLLAAGCATTSVEQCAQRDWYSAGLTDGRAGAPAEQLVQRWEACAAQGVSLDRERYEAGRADGLREYCTVSGGIDAGRKGRVYQDVCSGSGEQDFMSGYYLGALSTER